ncbi:MAG: NYN domain-containing protein [Eubacteriales bacterium]
MPGELKYAVLIDADNIAPKYIKIILNEIVNNGIATYKRIYGNWTSPSLASWKDVLLENSIVPIQQYDYTTGKNSTDSAMIIDAMDILYSGHVGGFCIASSDSDFTRLASRLRESGMTVIGMGEKKTPIPFIKACDQFKFLDAIYENTQSAVPKTEITVSGKRNSETKTESAAAKDDCKVLNSQTDILTIKNEIEKIVQESSDEDGYMLASELGNRLGKRFPDFDVRNYGKYRKLTDFLKSLDSLEIKAPKSTGGATNVKLVYVKFKTIQ